MKIKNNQECVRGKPKPQKAAPAGNNYTQVIQQRKHEQKYVLDSFFQYVSFLS